MKKIFTLALMLFAFVALNAQQILFEDFEGQTLPAGWTLIDNDGDSNNWELFAPQSGTTFHGTQCISSSSYINNVGALTPDNWLITPAIYLPTNATLTFWVVGQDASWAAEHYSVYVAHAPTVAAFTATTPVMYDQVATSTLTQQTVNLSSYTGDTIYIAFRHHNITDMFRLNIDDIEVFAQPTTPTIIANPTSITFPATALGNLKYASATVTAYNLTNNITASVTGPFAVSSDNVTYAATATLDTLGGTLYVRYAPDVAGASTGAITLSCTTTTATITLAGTAIDCSQAVSQLPWTEDFSGAVFPPLCWDVIAVLPDTTWDAYDYNGSWASCLGASQTRVEQLITKKFDFSNYNNTILMDFDFMSNYSYVSDGTKDMKVYASTDGGSTFDSIPLWSMSQFGQFSSWTPTLATVNLSSLAGQSSVVLKFTAEGSRCQVMFTNLKIYAYDDPTIVVREDEFSFYTEINTNDETTTEVAFYNLTGALTATTAAPFSVSGDGQTFGTTATLTGNTLYIRYTPTVAGQHTGTVTLASAGATNVTLNLSGEAYDCSTITLPYIETFDHNGNLPPCVTMVYANGDPTVNPMRIGLWDENSGDYVFGFSSYNQASDYTQYLITPELPDNTGLTVSFDWLSYSQSSAETMNIGYSSTDNNVGSFTWLGDEDYLTTTGDFETAVISLPAGARYVAFKYVSNYQYYLWLNNLTITGTIVGVDNHENIATIYPNPANNVLNINANSNISMVEVFNVMGQVVASFDANDVNTQINTSNFANGVYTVRIHTENGVSNQKFTVAR
jgi:hypothetical protein